MPDLCEKPEIFEPPQILSPLQEGMLLEGLRDPGKGLYLQQLIIRLSGRLDFGNLQRAFEHLLQRHGALRASFDLENRSGPRQILHERVVIPMQVEDISHMDGLTQDERLRNFLEEDRTLEFNPGDSPLMRLTVFRFGENESRIVWTSHHAILDGRSRAILVEELLSIESAFREGLTPALDQAPDFGSYLDWLAELDHFSSRGFWESQMEGIGDATSLPLAISVIPRQWGKRTLILDPTFRSRLREFAEDAGVTLNNVIQAAWAIFLSRNAGSEDVLFGVTRACRHLPGLDAGRMVGLLINTLPFRARPCRTKPVGEFLRELRDQWIAMRDHENTPMESIRDCCRFPVSGPMFHSAVVFERGTLHDLVSPEDDSWSSELLQRTGIPLTLSAFDGKSLRLELHHDGENYGGEDADRFLAQLHQLLRTMLDGEGQEIGNLCLISPEERHLVVGNWNDTETPFPEHARVEELFEEQVRRAPGAIALIGGSAKLSYRELDLRANVLGNRLIAEGLEPGDHVAVMMSRSPELVIALLGILKAGGVYLPIEPDSPQARTRDLLRQFRPRALLVRKETFRPRERDDPGFAVIELALDELDQSAGGAKPKHDLAGQSEHAAYVMFTSGSTSAPKGVIVPHRAIVRLVRNTDYVSLCPEDVIGHLSNPAFDASTFEIWGALLNGGAISIIDAETALSAPGLKRQIERDKITTVFLSTGLFNEFAREQPDLFKGLRFLLTGGDRASPEAFAAAARSSPSIDLVHVYGPTETTTFATAFRYDQRKAKGGPVPIGRPIANTTIYLLDERCEPVPVGVPGEIYIGGPGVALGYLDDPGLTGDRFIPDPFRPGENARLYRSGDLAHFLPDGNLEFLGRADRQIKVRGFRVEPAEIERKLNAFEEVSESAIIARFEDGNCTGLSAFVVLNVNASIRPGEIAARLASSLPAFMVPDSISILDRLPLNPNGKVDQLALETIPIHAASPTPDTELSTGPLSETEKVLKEIWLEILPIDDIGIHDNFFALGGHSLKAVRCMLQIQKRLGLALPMATLFEAGTIRELSARVDAGRTNSALGDGKSPPRETTDASRPASEAEQRIWNSSRQSSQPEMHIISRGFRIAGPLRADVLEKSIRQVLQRHKTLRTVFLQRDGEIVATPLDVLTFSFPVEDFRGLPPEERESRCREALIENSRRPFNLATDFPLRARLSILADDDHLLLLAVHHIVADGWSIEILRRDLFTAYQSLSTGEPDSLPRLPLSYDEFVEQERRQPSEILEQRLAAWEDRLAPPLPSLDTLFRKHSSDALEVESPINAVVHTLTLEKTQALERLAREQGGTLFLLLLAAYDLLLARITANGDVVVGTAVSGRLLPGSEDLVGSFAHLLPLRTRLDLSERFDQVLLRVKATVREALEDEGIPFGRIAELVPGRHPPRPNPVFDTTYIHFSEDAAHAVCPDGLEITVLENPIPNAKVPLALGSFLKGGTLQLRLRSQAQFFTQAQTDHLLDQFVFLLDQVGNDPSSAVADLSLVTPRARLLLADPSESLPAPDYEPVVATIEKIAATNPRSPALLSGREVLNYGELNMAAEGLAERLRNAGFRRGDTVAVHGPSCFALVVSMLGVLRAGGVFLLIETTLPEARKQLIMKEGGARLLIAFGDGARPVSGLSETVTVVEIETSAADQLASGVTSAGLAEVMRPEDPAYFFFTSGTTGIPNGILGSHQGLNHFIAWQRSRFRIGPEDRVAQLTRLSFDVILRDVFLPLTSGGAVCIPPPGLDDQPGRALEWLQDEAITVLHTVPARARAWLALGDPFTVSLPSLRHLFFSGEPLLERDVNAWRRIAPQARIVNLYGPTETTLVKSFYEVPSPAPAGIQPLGHPLPDTQLLVLDGRRRPCGVGEPGEIVIRTPFRTLGYPNAPDLQQKRFVSNPHTGDPDDLLYLTGDAGRYLPDGGVEFLGRLDHQVKINGVRIEPSEVNAAMASLPDVDSSHVLAVPGPGDQPMLVAFVVPARGRNLSAPDLRNDLIDRLPLACLPSRYRFLEKLPLNSNGKVDDRALIDLLGEAPTDQGPPLCDEIERIIADTFAGVLKTGPIGRDSDFFELGGHSLVAIQVVARLSAHFGRSISIRHLMTCPTPASLANVLKEEGMANPASSESARPARPRLSFMQEQMWFLDQFERANGPIYNIPFYLGCRGPLDVDALVRALSEIVRRHEILRTVYIDENGIPRQELLPARPIKIPVEDLTLLGEDERLESIARSARREVFRPFDLSRDLMLRARLIRQSDEEHILALCLHHIAGDGASLIILQRELAELYRAFHNGRASPLPELACQYADVAEKQRSEWEVTDHGAAFGYWRAKLEPTPWPLRLPQDHFPRDTDAAAGRIRVSVDPIVVEKLERLCRDRRQSLQVALLAAFKILLSRYTGATDITVGTIVAARGTPEAQDLIGFLANTLVLRTNLSGDPTVEGAIESVRAEFIAAMAHVDIPFEKVVESLRPPRDTNHSPFFNVFFSFFESEAEAPDFGDLKVTEVPSDAGKGKFDLTLAVTRQGKKIWATFDYRASLFHEETIGLFASRYLHLLARLGTHLETKLSDLALDDRSPSSTEDGGMTEAIGPPVFSPSIPIHEQFTAQAARTPDAVAAIDDRSRLSFGQLEALSNRLADGLMRCGIRPEHRVALVAERSLEMLVGLLGIIKAGAAYVPLDPGEPEERLRYLLGDCGASVVVTTPDLLERIPSGARHVIPISATNSGTTVAGGSEKPQLPKVSPENACYVIHTSGSTGKPKGVVVEHRQVLQYLNAMAVRTGWNGRGCAALVQPLSVDSTVTTLFPPLLAGGTLRLISKSAALDPRALAEAFDVHPVDLLKIAPSHLEALLESSFASRLMPREFLIIGGEVASERLLEKLRQLEFRCRVINHYGPTETTVGVATFEIENWATSRWPLPLGRPLANATFHLLDEHFRPVPRGLPGNLFVGGAAVARIYLGSPALTARSFFPDPFSQIPGARIYDTGDRARELPGGNFQFLGRRDHQLKLRGRRIDPREIEAVLETHPNVKRAIVMLSLNQDAGETLSAFLQTDAPGALSSDALRQQLLFQLPAALVPSRFVFLEELPRTSHGKFDLVALSKMSGAEPAGSPTPAAAAGDETILSRLAGLWGALLGVSTIEPRDDFFELGGHSLLATRLVSSIHDHFDVDLPLQTLFQGSTLEAMAEQIGRLLGTSPFPSEAGPDQAPPTSSSGIPLLPTQQGMWFLEHLQESGNAAYHVRGIWRFKGRLELGAFESAWNDLIERHEALRSTFPSRSGRPLQVILPFEKFRIPVIDLRGGEGDLEAEALRRADEFIKSPLDLATGPLFRLSLVRLRDEEHLFLFHAHHLITDGWSFGLLYRELEPLYAAHAAGSRYYLPHLSVSYREFVLRQSDYYRSDAFRERLGKWCGQLEGVKNALEIPTDFPRRSIQTFHGEVIRKALSPDLRERLVRLSRRERITPNMTFLGALHTMLFQLTGHETVAVGGAIAARTSSDAEKLVGCFINTIVTRGDLSGNPTFREILQRTRETFTDALTHQDIPFADIVRRMGGSRQADRSPLFQVSFNYQNAAMGSRLTLPGITVERVLPDRRTAKFDLAFMVFEHADIPALSLEFNADLFRRDTAEALLDHFALLLESIANNPDDRLSDLPKPLPAQAATLKRPRAGQASLVPPPLDRCLHQLVEEQADRSPDALAVAMGEDQLSYAQLDAAANALSHRLIEFGAGPEKVVAVHLTRSVEAVVALLGILKAGAAYLPLDLSDPPERLSHAIADSGTEVIISERALGSRLDLKGLTALWIDEEWDFLSKSTAPRTGVRVEPESLACLFYTSGSTGRPKGVAVQHRNLVNFTFTFASRFQIDAGDRFSQLTALSFDVSGEEIWPPLVSGGSIQIGCEALKAKPGDLIKWINQNGITICVLSTPLAEIAMDDPLLYATSLRVLITGGDRLRRWPTRIPPSRFINAYGPTETTIYSTEAELGKDPKNGTLPPIGFPLEGQQVHLLDEHFLPVPEGAPGEIFIGGECVTRGYFRNPAATAARFIPDPFSRRPGARLYRTGDRALLLPDGQLDFLGRIDNQVQIRGFRVEPGEVEAALAAHPSVELSAVTVQEDASGAPILIAHVILRPGESLDLTSMRKFLSQRLPSHMIPSRLSRHERFPLTSSGKILRSALPTIDLSRHQLDTAYVEPSGEIEKSLATFWIELLGIDKVGLDDDFFDLGGHSLLIIRLLSFIREHHGVAVSFSAFYENASINKLSDLIASQVTRQDSPAAPPPQTPQDPQSDSGDNSLRLIERRPLLSLIATRKLPLVDAASIGCLRSSLYKGTGIGKSEIVDGWYHGMPVLRTLRHTVFGTTGGIFLPRFDTDIYEEPEKLVDQLVECLELAASIGARVVSLTGLIPSATAYGESLASAVADRNDLPLITTGHATTASTVVFSVDRMFEAVGRDITRECVGFLGLGSIGLSSLELILDAFPHPAEIILCDLFMKRPLLEDTSRRLREEFGFQGGIEIIESKKGQVPATFYRARSIIGATNVPGILDVGSLAPGTVIVDDSAPHCFDSEEAMTRIRERGDILVTEGGFVKLPAPASITIYRPDVIEQAVQAHQLERPFHPDQITGCVLSAILNAADPSLPLVMGKVSLAASRLHYRKLSELGFQPADLHCLGQTIDEDHLAAFRKRFGTNAG